MCSSRLPQTSALSAAGPLELHSRSASRVAAVRCSCSSSGARELAPPPAAEIVAPEHHAEMSLVACRALGGTSWMWGGRCTPLAALDLKAREHIGQDGWPIATNDLEAYTGEACDILGCGPPDFSCPAPQCDAKDALSCDSLERWSRRPRLARALPELGRGLPVTVILDATVVDVEFDEMKTRVTGLVVASAKGRMTFRSAMRFVLAGGALETTRLLLVAQQTHPTMFGGQTGPLGRYYMGHLSGKIARIQFRRPPDAQIFQFLHGGASLSRRRITIDPVAQMRARLPNIAFAPSNPPFANPDHRIGILSAAFLALSVPAIGGRFVSEPIRLMNTTGQPHYLAHVRNILLDLPRTAHALVSLLGNRLRGAATAGLFLYDAKGVYPLHYHAEQLPHRDNRVTLAGACDRFGMPRLCIDFRFRDEDTERVVRAHDVLDQALKRANIGELIFDAEPPDRAARVLAQARDGFHQIGTTRMGRDAQDGVVDHDCRAFGISNLFMAGTSVFRTSGAANPTFSAVALALRLADHLVRVSPAEHVPAS